jgi:hypothetical protein
VQVQLSNLFHDVFCLERSERNGYKYEKVGDIMTQEHISGMLLMLISLLLLLFPKQIWKIAEAWKNSETTAPSKGYIIVLRCVGIVFLLIGFIVFMMWEPWI